MSTPHAFPHFGELPQELQIFIWKYAASPHGSLTPKVKFLIDMKNFSRRSFSGGLRFPFTCMTWRPSLYEHILRGSLLKKITKHTAWARENLVATCRLSKLTVLETWKNEIRVIEVNGRGPDNMSLQDQLAEQVLGPQWITSREGQKTKDDLAAFLDEL